MIPARNLLFFFFLLAILALPTAYLSWLEMWWKPLASLALGGMVLDFILGWRRFDVGLAREIRRNFPVGVWSDVTLKIDNPGTRTLRLRIHDHHPPDYGVEGMPREIILPAARSARVTYRVRPPRRGDGFFTGADLVVTSPMGLWRKKAFTRLEDRVKVFPNFREISHYVLLATDHRLSQIGVRRRQRRGEGNDFHQLREYRAGDSLRQIDWKATSRLRKLISKEYQDERDQQVVFLIDCGRRMRHAEEGRVHLDQVLNAMLLLAYVASRQGDAVGFMAFGGERRWYPPRKSGDAVRQLLSQTYDLESSTEAADYLVAARELMPLQRRRALVVILTNTRDEDHEELVRAVRLLRSRHLVVVADLREEILDETLGRTVRDFDGALRFHAVNEYLDSRHRNHETLQHHGAITLDLLAPQLAVALINQYQTIKASGRL